MVSQRTVIALSSFTLSTRLLPRGSTPLFLRSRTSTIALPTLHPRFFRSSPVTFKQAEPAATTANTSSPDPNKAAAPQSTSAIPPSESKIYSFSEISQLSSTPDPNRILIDVREPAELQSTGHIPSSLNIPLTTNPDFAFLPASEFLDRFGFLRPEKDVEVIFYCKSGVRSKAAARLAREGGFGGSQGEFPGSWLEWEKSGGAVER